MGGDHARAEVDHDEGREATRAGDDRDRTAEDRDRSAERRDRTAEVRDRRADGRDRRADALEHVDDLKAIDDSHGHAAGDRLPRQIGESLRAHLRSYDLLVRCGGDEFVCALAGLSMAQATNRFLLVNADLAGERASITAGLAELKEGDSLEDLIERADEALYRERQQRTA